MDKPLNQPMMLWARSNNCGYLLPVPRNTFTCGALRLNGVTCRTCPHPSPQRGCHDLLNLNQDRLFVLGFQSVCMISVRFSVSSQTCSSPSSPSIDTISLHTHDTRTRPAPTGMLPHTQTTIFTLQARAKTRAQHSLRYHSLTGCCGSDFCPVHAHLPSQSSSSYKKRVLLSPSYSS